MSVLCCRIPDFLIQIAARDLFNSAISDTGFSNTAIPDTLSRPLAVLGADERVLAVSTTARRNGVQVAMTAQDAQTRCPDLRLHRLDTATCTTEQATFLDVLSRWQLPIEAPGWGFAYLDMQDLARTQADAQMLGAELGRTVRAVMGEAMQPGLGWDSSKFTARAAATITAPGRMRLVGKADEPRFLNPLSIHLLPLPHAALQELHWLGIKSLGQYARLPPTAVWQRFGKAGREAQRWALGQDDRPVRPTVHATGDPIDITLDPPTAQLGVVLDAIMHILQPTLAGMQDRMEGCQRLGMTLHFLNGATRPLDHLFLEPVNHPDRLRACVGELLTSLVWPAEAERITLEPPTCVELAVQQMPLFAAADPPQPDHDEWRYKLAAKYGPIFFAGQITNPAHPIAEQRFGLAASP